MFDQNYGSGSTKWLLVFMACVVIYSLLTLLPDKGTGMKMDDASEMIGGIIATGAIVFLLRRWSRNRRQK
jgi:hypothetical protein